MTTVRFSLFFSAPINGQFLVKPQPLFTAFFFLFMACPIFAQTTWTGSSSTDWHTPGNWDTNAVPTNNDNVIIPDVANDPVISAAAVANIVRVQTDGVLTINANTSLTLYGSFWENGNSQAMTNQGTVHNNGSIVIGATASPGKSGLLNQGNFNNNAGGQITIDRASNYALWNNAGTFVNAASITIKATEVEGGFGITNDAIFNNNTGGQITVDRWTWTGFLNYGTFNNNANLTLGTTSTLGFRGIDNYGTINNNLGGQIKIDHILSLGLSTSNMFTNAAAITIGATSGAGSIGLGNQGTFYNNTGGQIKIDHATEDGLVNFSTFMNASTITIGEAASTGESGLANQGTFYNEAGGQIKIDRATKHGLLNFTTFNNAADITIGALESVGTYALYNLSTFNNNTGGTIKIDRSTTYGLYNRNGVFNNVANITIGATASVGNYGLYNIDATFNNNTGGQIKIDRSTEVGINIYSGTFNNAADIAIGATTSVGNYGLLNNGAFNNNACATLRSFAPINNLSGKTISNNGLFTLNTTSAHFNSGAFNNDGVLEYLQDNLIPNVTNNDVVVQPVSGECPVNNALQIGGASSFTIGATWYKNANLSGPAGNYNASANTFTTNGLAEGGTYPLYFSINDNVNNCARTVSIQLTYDDVTKPTITCPANQTVTVNAGCTRSIGTWALVSKSDNCAAPGNITESQSSAGDGLLSGHDDTETVTLTANDGNGNTETCSFTVTLQDVAKPTIACPANQTVAANANCMGEIGTWALVSKSDNCALSSNISESQNPAANTMLNGHNAAQTVTLTANDGNGNTQTCQFTVTLNDVSKPTITCPADQTVAADGNCSGSVGGYTLTSKSDNCALSANISAYQSPAANTPLSGHNTVQTVTFTANDGNGNTETCSFNVTLRDVSKPTITCPANQTVAADANCMGEIGTWALASKSDNCAISTNISENQSTAANTLLHGHNSAQTITLTAHDGNGNTQTCQFTVTLKDVGKPTITCPANQTVAVDGNCSTPIGTHILRAKSDNCALSANISESQSPAANTMVSGHNTIQTVTLTANDGNGNTQTCQFTITLKDITPPNIVCPQNIVANNTANQCAAILIYNQPAYTDNCTAALSLVSPSNTASGSTFPIGTTMVSWKVQDVAGNSAVCDFSITVLDNQPPSITCPANIIRGTDPGQCSAVVTYTTPTATDNCGVATVLRTSPANTASGEVFPKGTTTVEWKAADANAPTPNTATCSFTVTVNDTQTPAITCPANQAVGTTPTLCTGIATFSMPTGSDNCPLPSNAVSQISGPVSGTSFPKGITTVAFKVTDGVGLSKTCTFRIIVSDTESPMIACPANQAQNAEPGLCSAVVAYPIPTATDNCTPAPTVARISGPSSGTAFAVGATTVIWRAIDGAGRSSTCSFNVTITDTQAPTIACPANQSVVAPTGQCSTPVFYATATAADNCGISALFLQSGLPSGSTFPQGTTVNTWQATDEHALTQTCSFTVTVGCGTGAQAAGENRTAEPNAATAYDAPLSFTLAPNPAVSSVRIAIENMGETGGELTVRDAAGRLILLQQLGNEIVQQLSVEDFTSGVYLVTLRSAGQLATKRLVVQR